MPKFAALMKMSASIFMLLAVMYLALRLTTSLYRLLRPAPSRDVAQ